MPQQVDPNQGLSAAQVAQRQAAGQVNQAVAPPVRTVKQIISANVFTYFNLIFVVLTVLLCVVQSFRNLTFLPIIIANTLIGIFQEVRAKKILDELTMLNVPHATVIRAGQRQQIAVDQLVLDDIVVYQTGDQIAADAKVCAGEVLVNEALLTGEADEIKKSVGTALMSGSFVVAGACRAQVTAVGAAAYINQLTLAAKATPHGEQSEMIRSLDQLIKVIGVALVPLGILLVWQGLAVNHESLHDSITSMVAAILGMIPEGLYLLASVALAVSASRLAKQRVLLHEMKSIETLARVDTLCVDKTGTITENTMQVTAWQPVAGQVRATVQAQLTQLLSVLAPDNSTMQALQAAFPAPQPAQATAVLPFTSRNKYSAARFGATTYVIGAPEFVLGNSAALPPAVAAARERGQRVLVFGQATGLQATQLQGPVTPLAYVQLTNPVRPQAPQTFAYFRQQGVAVKVISGDNPATVAAVAQAAQIKGAADFVDATTLRTPAALQAAAAKHTVFGRVTPEQKRQLIQALQAQGHTVAMTGDGVNDVLALKDADCSIAMAAGSEAAIHVAQVVLLDSDFACLPAVVLEGRRVVNNIQRSASLFLVKNLFSFLMALLAVAFIFTYPLKPAQVSLWGLVTIGLPGFFLALQPNHERLRGHFLTNVMFLALPGGLTDVIVVGMMVALAQVFNLTYADYSTVAVLLLILVGLRVLYRTCQPFDRVRRLIYAGCLLALAGGSLATPWLFGLTWPSLRGWAILGLVALTTGPILHGTTWVVSRVEKWYHHQPGPSSHFSSR